MIASAPSFSALFCFQKSRIRAKPVLVLRRQYLLVGRIGVDVPHTLTRGVELAAHPPVSSRAGADVTPSGVQGARSAVVAGVRVARIAPRRHGRWGGSCRRRRVRVKFAGRRRRRRVLEDVVATITGEFRHDERGRDVSSSPLRGPCRGGSEGAEPRSFSGTCRKKDGKPMSREGCAASVGAAVVLLLYRLTDVGDDARGRAFDGTVRLVVQHPVDAAVRVVVGRLTGRAASDTSALQGASVQQRQITRRQQNHFVSKWNSFNCGRAKSPSRRSPNPATAVR